MGSIIGFGGRKESGKSELANICTKFGYKKLSFALPLKKLVAHLIGCSYKDINSLKNEYTNYIFEEKHCQYLSKKTSIPIDIVKEKMMNKTFHTVRELLQYIGTDLIRSYNTNWHVNEIKNMIEPNTDYVIDDVRFPNELEMIRELGGNCWFIARPKFDNISNHESETALRWQDFDNVIINDKTVEFLKFNWDIFMSNDYKTSCHKRDKIIGEIIGNDEKIKQLNNKGGITVLDTYFISQFEFTYNAKYLHNIHIQNISFIGNDCIVELDDGTTDIVTNPLMMEDLKKYIN